MRYKIVILFCFFATTIFSQSYVLKNKGALYPKKDSIQMDRMINYEINFYKRFSDFDSISINLRIFDDLTLYYLYQKEAIHIYDKSSGFYSSKINEEVVLRKKDRPYLPIFYHEISHYFLHKIITGKIPHWLNEGLAEYFANVQTNKKEIKHEMTDYEIGRIKTMIEIKDIDLKTFFTWGPNEFMKKEFTDDSYTYILSHGIVYFLITKNFEQFKQLVLKIKTGTSSEDAFNATYKGGFKQFETDFLTYYTQVEN
ncbi:MAG: DUF1570 domain-containing protein [Paludibacteraceae bacterium]|nr:DUF1570 domain-containing protein [Paludibacteraceae bacterium]